jgi:glycosyltransferase involved in cell wall biosynthesis
LTKGGAEISAYALYQGLQSRSDTETWFLGCSNKKTESRAGSCISQPFGDSEFIYDPTAHFDYSKFANPDPEFPRELDELIAKLSPDIVHSHHYAIFGLEAFRRIKNASPRTKIIVTLHEYLAICHNHGQMVKAKTNRLCRQESLLDCHACFPYISVQDFFLRKEYFHHFFNYVDRFVAPSQFLADRYIAWGLPASKVTVLENIMPWQQTTATPPPDPVPIEHQSKKPRLRVGFFGQMSPLKGVKVLLQAAKFLHDRRVRGVFFDVFGDYSNQPQEFQDEVVKALADEDVSGNLIYHGPYENEDVNTLMRSVDLVVMPSVWWENSPVVIKEAMVNRRPIICSNIGGMAEKVRPGIDGWHFSVGDAASLAMLLEDLLLNPEALQKMRATLKVPTAPEDSLAEHMRLYEDVRAGKLSVDEDAPRAAAVA